MKKIYNKKKKVKKDELVYIKINKDGSSILEYKSGQVLIKIRKPK